MKPIRMKFPGNLSVNIFTLEFKEEGMGFEGIMRGCKHTDKYHYDINNHFIVKNLILFSVN